MESHSALQNLLEVSPLLLHAEVSNHDLQLGGQTLELHGVVFLAHYDLHLEDLSRFLVFQLYLHLLDVRLLLHHDESGRRRGCILNLGALEGLDSIFLGLGEFIGGRSDGVMAGCGIARVLNHGVEVLDTDKLASGLVHGHTHLGEGGTIAILACIVK